MTGKLYIVSTPIGNLEDITLRALRILKEADIIAAEDTRHSLKLLNYYGISKPLLSYWGEREKARSGEVLRRLLNGQTVALISDAGTPGISDPGEVLVREAVKAGIDVIPVPGASALIAALSVSGLNTGCFAFAGFLPPKKSQRIKQLTEMSFEARTLVLYEAPHRILDALHDIESVFGTRRIAVAKEITKIHEEILRGIPTDVIEELQKKTISGEYVIMIEGKGSDEKNTYPDAINEVVLLIKKGMGRKEAVRKIAGQYRLSSKELYDKSLQ